MSFRDHKADAAVNSNASAFEHAQECVALQRDLAHQSLVLLGAWATGSSESCRSYVEITKWLILECGLNIIAIEADSGPAQRVNEFILGQNECGTAGEALADFRSFPRWRWRNTVISDFVSWLRRHNDSVSTAHKVRFCGLHSRNTFAAIDQALSVLANEPGAHADAQRLYHALDPLGCSWELQRLTPRERRQVGEALSQVDVQGESSEAGEQPYLRSWLLDPTEPIRSLHSRHMFEQILNLKQQHEQQHNSECKMVVWAQNLSISGGRQPNQYGLTQLLREHYGAGCVAIGQTCYSGSITAADGWSAPAQRLRLPEAQAESVEALFHQAGKAKFYLPLDKLLAEHLTAGYWHREIGGIYRPQQQGCSHYIPWCGTNHFDAIIHLDASGPLEPLDPTVQWIIGDGDGDGQPPL